MSAFKFALCAVTAVLASTLASVGTGNSAAHAQTMAEYCGTLSNAQCMAKAKALLAQEGTSPFKTAATYQAMCKTGERAACDELYPLLLDRRYSTASVVMFDKVYSDLCYQQRLGWACGDMGLVYSGWADDYSAWAQDWNKVYQPAFTGCDRNAAFGCFAMMMLYGDERSPKKNLESAVSFGIKACQAGEKLGCHYVMGIAVNLPDPGLARWSERLVPSLEKGCTMGVREICEDLPSIRLLASRTQTYGPDAATAMLVVDNGLAEQNWGGSVMHALRQSGDRRVVEYAVNKVAAAGKLSYLAHEDLPAMNRMLAGTTAGSHVAGEIGRRDALDARARQASTPAPQTPTTSWPKAPTTRRSSSNSSSSSAPCRWTTYGGTGGGSVCVKE